MRQFEVGQKVVYTRDKYTSRPGPRAKNIVASQHGESYEYQVDKYWLVERVLPDGRLDLVTRRGKLHTVDADDPRLRPANLIEKLIKGHLFPRGASPGLSSMSN